MLCSLSLYEDGNFTPMRNQLFLSRAEVGSPSTSQFSTSSVTAVLQVSVGSRRVRKTQYCLHVVLGQAKVKLCLNGDTT